MTRQTVRLKLKKCSSDSNEMPSMQLDEDDERTGWSKMSEMRICSQDWTTTGEVCKICLRR